MNKLIRWGIIGVTTFILASCNLRLYSKVPETTQYKDTEAQFAFLKSALQNGAAEEMQTVFPEGYFFTHVLYGLSWVNVGLAENLDPAVREQALFEARQAYARLSEPAGKAPFPANQTPPHGIFYLGWRNYLLSGILLLQQPSPLNQRELREFQANCEAIANALRDSEPLFLPSYPQEVWPVDTFPAMLSLRGHTMLINNRYEPVIEAWLAETKAELRQQAIPLANHRQAPFVQAPRGTSQALIQRFLPELDPAWAAESYVLFRRGFVTQRLGLPGVLEYPTLAQTSPAQTGQGLAKGDVDSGPLVAGVSLSATAVALGTAKLNGDEALHSAIWQASELVGLSFIWRRGAEQKRYWFGLLPVTDAFLLWSQTARPWFGQPVAATNQQYFWWWRWPIHGLSLALWIGLMWGVSHRRKARKQRRAALQRRRTHDEPPSAQLSALPQRR